LRTSLRLSIREDSNRRLDSQRQILLFAYNLVHWFKRLCLPKEYLYATLDTIRTDFLVLPAKLTKEGSKNVLVLPHDYHYQKEFTNALKTIDRLRLP
jgi:Transposase DDE domain group 1